MMLNRKFLRFCYTMTVFLTRKKYEFAFPGRGLREATFDLGPVTFGVLKPCVARL